VAGEKVKGHPIVVQRQKAIKLADHSHLLFLNVKEQDTLKVLIAELPKRVLTVGEDTNFNAYGGMIRFATVENKIKLVINLEAARTGEIIFSSKLLNVAEVYSK
jgi:hypothetical protein